MTKLLIIVVLAFAVPMATPGCKTAPSARVVQVQTLKGVGETAQAAVELSARLYRDNRISAVQARQVMEFYDEKFQPAYRLAVAAVSANLDSIASPDVAALAAQLAELVQSYQNSSR